MKTFIVGVLIFGAAFVAPLVSHAAMYEYVTTSGYVSSEENIMSLSQAFSYPTDISPYSGVMLITDMSQMIPIGTYVSGAQ